MTEIEHKIADIRAQIDAVATKRAERKHQLAVSEDIRRGALETLREQFGIVDLSEVGKLLAELESTLTESLATVEEQLRIADEC